MTRKALIFSLTLNLALGFLFFTRARRTDPSAHKELAGQELQTLATAQHSPISQMAPTETVPDVFYWSSLESADLAEYAARLRAIRCPEHVVRMVVESEVSKRYMPRISEVASRVQGRAFDILAAGSEALEKIVTTEFKDLEALDKEVREIRDKAIGQEAVHATPERGHGAERITPLQDFLDPDQARQALQATGRFAVKGEEARRNKEPAESIKKLKDEEQTELRSVLSEEQLAEYNLRQALPGSMKQNRGTFPASPEEWRRIVEIESAARATNAQGVEVEYSICQLLGPERAAQFKRHGSHTFRQFAEITQEAGLPEEVAVAAHEVRQQAEKQMASIDGQPAPEAYRRKLRQVWQANTTSKLEALLGPENTAAYVDTYGKWLRDR